MPETKVLTPEGAVKKIAEGNLDFEGATIEGDLDFSTKEGPLRIYVSPLLAQSVHWAAPTVSLVVVKE